MLAEFAAFNLSLAVFVIAIKRTTILMSAVLAWWFFREPLKERLVPTLIVLAGIFGIVVAA